MSGWADVDAWKAQQVERAPRKPERHPLERTRHAVYHLTRFADCYRVQLVKGPVRRMHPEHLSRLGAATRRRVELLALCGVLQARVPGQLYHRSTAKRERVTCEACLVALDGEMEAGRACLASDGKAVVFVARSTVVDATAPRIY